MSENNPRETERGLGSDVLGDLLAGGVQRVSVALATVGVAGPPDLASLVDRDFHGSLDLPPISWTHRKEI